LLRKEYVLLLKENTEITRNHYFEGHLFTENFVPGEAMFWILK
jgi:hypothetical protein